MLSGTIFNHKHSLIVMATHRRNNYTEQEDALPNVSGTKDSLHEALGRADGLIQNETRRSTRKSSWTGVIIPALILSIGLLVLSDHVHWQMQDFSSYSRSLKIADSPSQSLSTLLLEEVVPVVSSRSNDRNDKSSREAMNDSASHRLRTVGEIKDRMVLPCNYVHDGFYIADSNEILSQVYQSLIHHLDDDVIPVLVEVGGHDGITKSLSLKASRCLSMNTLLIEASPYNYRTLEKARSYDWTVNAALCDGDQVDLVEVDSNSGLNHFVGGSNNNPPKETTVRANCTSVDAEMDKLRALLPVEQQDKLQLAMLVLDVEGSEGKAVNGIQRYRPHKVFMETKHLKMPARKKINAWAQNHNLAGAKCSRQDTCFGFDPLIGEQTVEFLKALLYGARLKLPQHTHATKKSSEAYMFYGE